ncbi:LolA family protein [Natronorubrum sp. FCH18a]|uniref:LolA family protein n=1 Tax=Natronorubrum sp. FCH18a TaxID=3447018 RepID=UPI003F50F635
MSPSDATHRSALLLVVVALACLSAGCVALPDEGVSQDHLEDRFAETEPPEELAATVEVTETVDGEVTTHTETVWLRADGTSRIETTEDGSEMVIVNDGSERYFHDREADTVRSYEIDSNATPYLEALYEQPERYVEAYDVTDIEETTVDDRDTYHVTFDPPANETIDRSISVQLGPDEYVLPLETSEVDTAERSADRVELWLDRETMFPVKHSIAGDGIELETTYRALSFDEPLDEALFEPPEADDGSEPDEFVFPTITNHESVDEADAAAPFTVAEPETDALPAAVELEEISRYEFHDENRTQVTLSYRNGDGDSVAVTTSDGQRQFAIGGQSIDVGNATGTIVHTDEGTELQWSCDGLYYSVFAGGGYGSETATAIGESLPTEC